MRPRAGGARTVWSSGASTAAWRHASQAHRVVAPLSPIVFRTGRILCPMAGSGEKREGIMEEARFEEPENDPPGHGVVIIFTVFFEAGLAPFSLFLGWLLGHPPLAKFVWSFADAVWGVVAALPLIALFLAML